MTNIEIVTALSLALMTAILGWALGLEMGIEKGRAMLARELRPTIDQLKAEAKALDDRLQSEVTGLHDLAEGIRSAVNRFHARQNGGRPVLIEVPHIDEVPTLESQGLRLKPREE
jgi:hypothetical protein